MELPARCIVGRTPFAPLRLSHESVSREHAVIEWRRGYWRLRDLGSRNGTTINGRACSSSFHELTRGDVLAFGDPQHGWTLIDVGPPPPAAVAEDGTIRVGRGQVLLLPDDVTPELSIAETADGWFCDDGDASREVHGDGTVLTDGRRWNLLLPAKPTDPTTLAGASNPHLDDLTATFEFDRTEEYVRLTLHHAANRIALPARAHDYLMLTLARTRVREETEAGLDPVEAGWTDSLALSKALNIAPERLNVQIFRARRAVAEHGVIDAARIIERRAHTRQLRFGVADIRFEPLY
ncbi:MAG: FHA domain-containing protein [Gemmatimonadota bacterium]